MNKPGAISLSNSLPLRAEQFRRRECRGYFAGILPESTKRDIIARNLGISAKNDFAMIARIGGEYDSEKITSKHFDRFAEEAGLGKPLVKLRVRELAEEINLVLSAIMTENTVQAEIAKLIQTRCKHIVALLKS